MLVPWSPEASQPKVAFTVQGVELRWITSLALQLRCRSISTCERVAFVALATSEISLASWVSIKQYEQVGRW